MNSPGASDLRRYVAYVTLVNVMAPCRFNPNCIESSINNYYLIMHLGSLFFRLGTKMYIL